MDVPATGEIRLLGAIQGVGPNGPAILQGKRQRTLLALLALHPGERITAHRLTAGLWGEGEPRTSLRTLQSHLTRIKQALAAAGLPDALSAAPSGFSLDLAPSAVDAVRFADFVRSGRQQLDAGAPEPAVTELRQALALWCGEPLQDAQPWSWAASEVERLHELRLTALDLLFAAQLQLGAHAAIICELSQHVRAYPLREHSASLLMRALHQDGRNAEALAVYQRLREHLADELGADPSPSVQDMHLSLLRGEAPPAPPVGAPRPAGPALPQRTAPAELPPRVGHFTGRTAELAALHRMVTDPAVAAAAQLAMISGPGGMGKTALAIEWAQQLADRCPDGQIFLDLRGHDPALTIAPADVIRHALRALGVPADRTPADLAEQTSLYRSLLHQRRMLILLDNAGSPEQVEPLIPASAGNLLTCTSRQEMPGLDVRHVVHRVQLDVLNSVDALTLLGRVLGSDRVAAESGHAVELVRLCGGMPLALRIAAAKLAQRPSLSIENFVAELAAGDRLESLSIPGEAAGVQAVFSSAYRTLSPPAAQAFRLLGLHPGVTFSRELTGSLIESPPGPLLDELTAAHLATEVAPGRYRFHDLIKWYAGMRTEHDDAPEVRSKTIAGIVSWYLSLAHAANRTLTPGRYRADEDPPRDLPMPPFPDEHEPALAFVDAERGNLPPIAQLALDNGDPGATWRFGYLLIGYYDQRGHWHELAQLCQNALHAAEQLADPAVEGLVRIVTGVTRNHMHQHDRAVVELQHAAEMMRSAQDTWGEGVALNNLAVAHRWLRQFPSAIEAFEQALALHAANASARAMAQTLNNIGDAYTKMGRADLALDRLRQALQANPPGYQRSEAIIHNSLAQALVRTGDPLTAVAHCKRALDLCRDIGDRWGEVDSRNNLALALSDLGNNDAAIDELGAALVISREISDRYMESSTLTNLGAARVRSGATAQAAEDLHLALAIRADIPDTYEEARVYRHLAELAASLYRTEEAQRHREHAIDLFRKANADAEADELGQLR